MSKYILIALVVVSGGWLLWSSARADDKRTIVYNDCMSAYHANALPLPEYLQDCMK